MKIDLTAIVALSLALLLPSVLVIEAEAKLVPVPNQDHTRGQLSVMLVMPAALTGGLALMLGMARMN